VNLSSRKLKKADDILSLPLELEVEFSILSMISDYSPGP
jgi:hypothetical protein